MFQGKVKELDEKAVSPEKITSTCPSKLFPPKVQQRLLDSEMLAALVDSMPIPGQVQEEAPNDSREGVWPVTMWIRAYDVENPHLTGSQI